MIDRKRHVTVTISIRDGVAVPNGINDIVFASTQSMSMQLEVEDPPEKVMSVAANAAEEVARRILNVPTPEREGGRS